MSGRIRGFYPTLSWLILVVFLTGCAAPVTEPTPASTLTPSATSPATNTPLSTATPTPAFTATTTPTPTEDTRLIAYYWAQWPIVPVISPRAVEIYQIGLTLGNNPQAFSVVGDCQSVPNAFLGLYSTDRYRLPEGRESLQLTIDYYAATFAHESASVRDGLSAPSALSPLWADPAQCEPNEDPVSCELRLHHPSIVFINLGTNWQEGASAERYGEYLRQIVDLIIASGAVPVLSTKADNVEGDHSINRVTAEIAYEYDIPLYNFWLAADSLPNHGLDSARENIYLIPDAWDLRSYVALQTLDALRLAFAAAEVP